MSIATQIERLQNAKESIKQKLIEKGVEVSDDVKLDQYGELIETIPSGGGENTLKKLLDTTKSCARLFANYTGSSVDDLIKYNDTENVKTFDYMFDTCYNAISFPLINTSKGTSMKYMFNYCVNAQTLPDIDTSSTTTYEYTYCQCLSLKHLQRRNTNKVTNWTSAFRQCQLLETIDISAFKNMSSTYASQTWSYCYSLKALIIRSLGTSYAIHSNTFQNCHHILGTSHSTYNPNGDKDGYIYVPRNMVDTLKSATNWSVYADQIRALEDYTVDGTTTGDLDMDKVNGVN